MPVSTHSGRDGRREEGTGEGRGLRRRVKLVGGGIAVQCDGMSWTRKPFRASLCLRNAQRSTSISLPSLPHAVHFRPHLCDLLTNLIPLPFHTEVRGVLLHNGDEVSRVVFDFFQVRRSARSMSAPRSLTHTYWISLSTVIYLSRGP